jgi:hypothetical protein
MRPKKIIAPLMGFILGLLLSACHAAGAPSSPLQLTQTSSSSTPTYTLATPYSMQPAAGICAMFDGPSVEITINVDMPSPRCAKIRPDQILTVINATSSTIRFSTGRFSSTVLPGQQSTIDLPFGDYLAPGVHLISVTPYFGAELWLEVGK